MITTNKAVLLVADERSMDDINYEAIERLTEETSVEGIWRRNKTPVMLEQDAGRIKRKYPVIYLPRFIFGPDDFIRFCHSHGIECGEFISGKKYDTAKDRCFLCSVGHQHDRNGDPITPLFVYNQKTENVNDIILMDSENFYVKIEYGCLKKGMLMICPKEHYLSAARIPDKLMDEYYQMMADVEFLLKAVYGEGPVIFFEHGAAPSGFTSHAKSIVHAHTHVAWGIKFEQTYIDMVCLEEVHDIKKLKDTKYFSYQEGTDGKLLAVWDKNVYVQRQYPRQVIGMMLGIPNEKTNWRREAFMENIVGTFDDFYAYLQRNRKFLCARIANATEGFVMGYPMRKL